MKYETGRAWTFVANNFSLWLSVFRFLQKKRDSFTFRSFARLAWRGGLLLLLLLAIQPAPLLITLGPRQTVETKLPVLGVHTRLTDEVEEWKIKRTLEMVREMGGTTIVEFFPWAYYHAADGGFAWEHPDLVVDHAHAQGLTVIARLGFTPDWARPDDTPLNYIDEAAYADFAVYAAAFAERYAGKVDYLIVWNEPNLSFEWGYRETTAVDYVNMMGVVYTAVKEANPDMQVLGGALAPTLEPKGSPWGTNDLVYLEEMYQAGAADFMDGLAVHTYGLKFPASAEPQPQVVNYRRVELIREVMLAYGDDNPIHITEMGWNDHPRWTRAVRPGQRIAYTTEALDYTAAELPYVESASIWMFRTPAPIKSYMDYYTLVTPEFIPKPIYLELQRVAREE